MPDKIRYSKIDEGIQIIKFSGRLNNQCILITYPEHFSQSNAVKMLYHTIKNDKNLVKNVVLLSYRNINALKDIFYQHSIGQKHFNFGTIRVALNLDMHLRNKEKSKGNETKAFLQLRKFFITEDGKNGIRSDVDHFLSVKQLLQKFHIDSSPCPQIHEAGFLKILRRGLSFLNHYIPGLKSRVSTFVDNLLCQSYRSFFKEYEKSHEILIQNGFQSSLVTFLTSEMIPQIGQKIAKISYSFMKEYSVQQDHLHSSQTFYYPISNNSYLNLMGTVYGGLILLFVGLVNSVALVAQNSQTLTSSLSIFHLIEIFSFGIELKIYGDFTITMLYLVMKLMLKLLTGKLMMLRIKGDKLVDLEFVLVTGISLILSLYFAIFNFSLYYLSAISSILLLAKSKKLFLLVLLLSLWTYFDLKLDTIKSLMTTLDLERLKFVFTNLIQTVLSKIQTISLQAKIIVIPLLYGFSTFIN